MSKMSKISKTSKKPDGYVSYGYLCRIGCFGGDFGPGANVELYKKHWQTKIPFETTGENSKRAMIELVTEPDLKAWLEKHAAKVKQRQEEFIKYQEEERRKTEEERKNKGT